MTTFVFPCDPVSGRGFDGVFAGEVAVARFVDGSTVASVDHDGLRDGVARFRLLPAEPDRVLYRGWMVSVDEYELMAGALAERGFTMVSSPAQFAAAHRIDGWLDAFEGLTFRSVLVPDFGDESALRAAAAVLGSERFFVKDFVKSLKHDPLASVAVGVDGERGLLATADRFVAGQGEWLSGGVVVREFVGLPADRVEVRGWWRDGVWRDFTAHPDFAGAVSVPVVPAGLLAVVSERLSGLGVAFVSVDFTVTDAGDWLVVEVGDGQVSGFPVGVADAVVEAILS